MILTIFNRKRCFQCGETLTMFKSVDFCSLHCATLHECNAMYVGLPITKDATISIHDAIYDIHGYKPGAIEIVSTYMRIPEHIHNEAIYFGWHDTEVCIKLYDFLRGEVKNGTQ